MVQGLIQKDQNIEVYHSYDGAAFVLIYTILGTGDYVDAGINTSIGAETIGSNTIGGASGATAHPFIINFPVHSDRFQTLRHKFVATGVGHAQINSYTVKDIRLKGSKVLPQNTI